MTKNNKLLFGGSCSVDTFLQENTQKNALGALYFTVSDHEVQATKAQSNIPSLHVPIQRLGGDETACECWLRHGTGQQNRVGDIHYQHDDDVLFGVAHIAESAFKQDENQTSLQQATASAYSQIFALLEQMPYPYIFRFWNYIADINVHSDGLERYRQFNLGRQGAFVAYKRDITGNVPAACALGFSQDEFDQKSGQKTLSIAFMAGRAPATAIENPRQVSAYQYPEQYGPVSPIFSRAILVKLAQSELLFISGTASIVGHATQHASDAVTQTREALINIEAILAQANSVADSATFSLAGLHYRVYVRHPEHVTAIRDELKRYIGSLPVAHYFRADICRLDLLLEIEASVEYACTPSSLEMKR